MEWELVGLATALELALAQAQALELVLVVDLDLVTVVEDHKHMLHQLCKSLPRGCSSHARALGH